MAGNEKSIQSNPDTIKIQGEDLLDLWKYLQDRADMLKERQWIVGTWILSLLSGIVAFSLNQATLAITDTGLLVEKPLAAMILGLVGLLVCTYGFLVILSYGKHIQRNWDRAKRVKENITDLNLYWNPETSDTEVNNESLPPESKYLIVVLVGFSILFFIAGLISILALLNS